MTAAPPISHDSEAGRFTAELDGHIAYLDYKRRQDGRLDYHSTFVPEALRGRGIASRLVEHAVRHAADRGLKVVPTCPFVASWLERHPDLRRTVVD